MFGSRIAGRAHLAFGMGPYRCQALKKLYLPAVITNLLCRSKNIGLNNLVLT